MSLLDKLMEKKDIDTYLRLRIRRLKQENTERIKNYPKANREKVVIRNEARIRELSKLGDALRANTIKKKCKLMWKHFNYPPKKDTKSEEKVGKIIHDSVKGIKKPTREEEKRVLELISEETVGGRNDKE